MGRKEREYSRVTAAEKLVNDLCTKHSKALWQVIPSQIIVLGIENSERNEKNKVLAKVRPIKGVEKAILTLNNIKVRYVIELYWTDWNLWSEKQKQWLIFHELLHIHRDGSKTVKHDCEDFKLILDAVGVEWFKKNDGLPNLINDVVEFNMDLLPGLDEYKDEMEDDEHANDSRPEKEAIAEDVEDAEDAEDVSEEDAEDAF